MPIRKGIKISSTKRGHHERHKKNFLKSKKQLHREKQIKENIFKKSKTQLKKDNLEVPEKKKKKTNTQQYKNHVASYNEDDVLDMVYDSDSEQEKDSESENEENPEIEEMEHQVHISSESVPTKKMRELLPIKTKTGVVPRLGEAQKIDHKVVEEEEEEDEEEEAEVEEDVDENRDSDEDILEDKREKPKIKKTVLSAAELLMEREQEVQKQRFRIGVICSGLLEKPEEKVKNLGILLDLIEAVGEDGENHMLSIRKLAMLSITEVFKDIIPEYRVGIVDLQTQKVKKDTLNRITYENSMLNFYKKLLKTMEDTVKAFQRRKYGPRPNKEQLLLAEVAVQCLCELLITHPYFNYSTNIAQLLVVLLNASNVNVRTQIHKTFTKLFKTDRRLDLTLHIVRHINHLVKKKAGSVFVDVVTCLIFLQIKNVNLDAEKEQEMKQKRLEQKKSRLISMSKRERKRKKKLADLEKEMLETQAEENKQTKNKKLTDISKLVFTIYFRVLKEYPNSKLLSATLEGLAQFAHIINIEFFSDLIEVLNHLVENVELGYREQLHCIQTVFTILSGQGEVLNIDPARFYTHLYRSLLHVNAGKTHCDIESIVVTLENVLIKRRKNITKQRYLAFLKRLMTLSLQIQHNGSLSCLAIIKNAMQLNSSLDILLDNELKVGSGKFDPEIEEPEFSNANCTSLFELALLRRHYHPTVVKMADHIAAGVPVSGQGILEPTISKLTPLDLLKNFDSSEMAFNPPIPPPLKDVKMKANTRKYEFLDGTLQQECANQLRNPIHERKRKNSIRLNFYSDLKKIKI